MEINTPENLKHWEEAHIVHAAGIYDQRREEWMEKVDKIVL
jgi:hypothetical protein